MNSRTIDRFVNLCANSPASFISGKFFVYTSTSDWYSYLFPQALLKKKCYRQESNLEALNQLIVLLTSAPIHPLHLSHGNFSYIHQLLIGTPIFFRRSIEEEVLSSGIEPRSSQSIDRFVIHCANSPTTYKQGKVTVYIWYDDYSSVLLK